MATIVSDLAQSSLQPSAIHEIVNTLNRLIESGDGSSDFQVLLLKLDYLQRLLVGLNVDDNIVAMVGHAYNIIDEMDKSDVEPVVEALKIRTGHCGRPTFDVKAEQLLYLLEQGFKVFDISKIVGVSQRTVERRMSSFGLSVSGLRLYYLKVVGANINKMYNVCYFQVILMFFRHV